MKSTELIARIRRRRQFVAYACIGLVGVSIDFCSFAVFQRVFGWHYQVANMLSTSLGILVNFLLNARFNFQVRERLFMRLMSFYAVGLTGMGVTAFLLAVLVGWFGLPALLVKLMTLVVVLLLQYNLNRWVTFRQTPPTAKRQFS